MIRRLNIDQIILTLLLLILVVQDSRSFQSKIALNDKAFEIGTFSSMLISRSIKDILLQLNDEMELKGKLLYIRKEDQDMAKRKLYLTIQIVVLTITLLFSVTIFKNEPQQLYHVPFVEKLTSA